MHVTAFIRLRRQVRFALLIGFASSVAAAARAEPRVGVAESRESSRTSAPCQPMPTSLRRRAAWPSEWRNSGFRD
jgi:hypothetical protein